MRVSDLANRRGSKKLHFLPIANTTARDHLAATVGIFSPESVALPLAKFRTQSLHQDTPALKQLRAGIGRLVAEFKTSPALRFLWTVI